MEQLGAGSRSESIEALPESAFELVGTHCWDAIPRRHRAASYRRRSRVLAFALVSVEPRVTCGDDDSGERLRSASNMPARTHNPSVAGSSPARPTRETAGQRPVLRPRVRTRTTCVPRWSRIGRAAVQRLRRRRPWADFLSDISVSNLGRYAGLSRHDVGEGGPLPRRKSICVSTLRVFSGTISLPATIPESGS